MATETEKKDNFTQQQYTPATAPEEYKPVDKGQFQEYQTAEKPADYTGVDPTQFQQYQNVEQPKDFEGVDQSQFQQYQNVEKPAEYQNVDQSQFQQYQGVGENDVQKMDHVDTTEYEKMLDEWVNAQQQQSENQINYNVEKGTKELQRQEEDAQPEFQKQRNQIDYDEQRALHNQGLYAEARGDRGGIGMAQYNSVQNNAAQARLSVSQAQQKLATDIARQIEDLRAQGEFEKANAALQLAQSKLAQLMELWQFATNANMSIDQFNATVDQFILQFNQQTAQLNNEQAWNLRQDALAIQQMNDQNYWNTAEFNQRVQQLNNEQLWNLRQDALNTQQLNNQNYWNTQEYNQRAQQLNNEQLWNLRQDELNTQQLNNQNYWTTQEYNQRAQQLNNEQLWAIRQDELNTRQLNDQNYWNTQDYNLNVQRYNNDILENNRSIAASSGSTLLGMGIMPSEEQLAAMGLTQSQAQSYLDAVALANASRGGGGGGGGSQETSLYNANAISMRALANTLDDLTESQIANNRYATQEEIDDAIAYATSTVKRTMNLSDADVAYIEEWAKAAGDRGNASRDLATKNKNVLFT